MTYLNSLKKIIKPVILGFVAMAAVSTSAINTAQAEGYDAGYYAHVEDVAYWDVLNMRKWPAPYSQKVASIPDNGWGIWVQRCIVKPGTSDWCKVKYAGNWGWVNKRYINEYQY